MFDYIHCKSVGHLIYGKIFSEKKFLATIFTVVMVREFLPLRTFRKTTTNARGCIKSVSFKALSFLPLIYHIFLTTLL